MSELINKNDNTATIRWKLLTGASALALTVSFLCTDVGRAEDSGRPVLWLEADGQFDQLSGSASKWIPDFVSTPHGGPLAGQFSGYQRNPKIGFDAGASVNFQPDSSDWVFSAALHIGRARQAGRAEKHANYLPVVQIGAYEKLAGLYASFYNGIAQTTESHMFADFQAGKDVGIGSADTVVRAGVRIAQMKSRSDLHVSSAFPYTYYGSAFNHANNHTSRKFQGVGPSVAWDGSVPLAGSRQGGELTIDWSANAALLFGRQETRQKVSGIYTQGFYNWNDRRYVAYRQSASSSSARKRNITVPDVGGLIGISYRLQSTKFTLGYRAEYLFGVLDGGVAVSQKANRGFYGPYASFSVGIGD